MGANNNKGVEFGCLNLLITRLQSQSVTITHNKSLPRTRSMLIWSLSILICLLLSTLLVCLLLIWTQVKSSESYVKTDGQSVSLSWCQVPIWDLRPDFFPPPLVAGLLMWGALSDERTGLSFTMYPYPWKRVYRSAKFRFPRIYLHGNVFCRLVL
jgi:hypothetical protein